MGGVVAAHKFAMDAEAAGAAQREEKSLLLVSKTSSMTTTGSAQSEEDSLSLMSDLVGMVSVDYCIDSDR